MIKTASVYALILLATSTAGYSHASDVQLARPEELGFSAERLDRIDRFYGAKVKSGEMAGIVTLVARHGKIVQFSAIGYADTGMRRKLEKGATFRLYSMTKPIAATALMILYEEGKFQLDDPISKYIPEFANIRVLRTPDSPITDTVPAVREPTIHDLFRHTAGLMHGGEPKKNAVDAAYIEADLFGLDTSLADMIRRLAKIPLRYQPGVKFEYSIGQDVQARLVQLLSGMPFDEFLQKRLFGPLGMKDSGYWTKDSSRLAAVHWSKDGRLVPCDTTHGCPKPTSFLLESSNINSYTTNHVHQGGSYGLFATTEDYWRFAQMMLNGGTLNGHRLLSPSTVHYMARDHLGAVSLLNRNGESTGMAGVWALP